MDIKSFSNGETFLFSTAKFQKIIYARQDNIPIRFIRQLNTFKIVKEPLVNAENIISVKAGTKEIKAPIITNFFDVFKYLKFVKQSTSKNTEIPRPITFKIKVSTAATV